MRRILMMCATMIVFFVAGCEKTDEGYWDPIDGYVSCRVTTETTNTPRGDYAVFPLSAKDSFSGLTSYAGNKHNLWTLKTDAGETRYNLCAGDLIESEDCSLFTEWWSWMDGYGQLHCGGNFPAKSKYVIVVRVFVDGGSMEAHKIVELGDKNATIDAKVHFPQGKDDVYSELVEAEWEIIIDKYRAEQGN